LRPFRIVVASALVVASAACNGSSSTSTGVADLVVEINVPTAGNADVNIAGPSSYNVDMAASGTLLSLATGTYVITAKPARVGDPIVSQVDTGIVTAGSSSGKSVTITLNNNTIDTVVVNYAPRPGSGFLWTASATSSVDRINGYVSQQLQNLPSLGSPPPTVSVDGRPLQGTPGPLAFDQSGNLWVGTAAPNTISEYLYTQFTLGTTTGPSGTTFAPPDVATAMAFDPAGNLWVAFSDASNVVEYPSSTLATAPAIQRTISLPSLTSGPAGLAFDNFGNLWVTASTSGAIIELPALLLAGNDSVKAIVLQKPQTAGVVAPAFDPLGRLWVVTVANTILGFSAAQTQAFDSLTTPSEVVTISATGSPRAAAFDNSQDLWIAEGTGNTVVELTSTQLLAGGTQMPLTTLSSISAFSNTVGMAFSPKGQFVPLAGQRAPSIITSKGRRVVRYGA
jgi:sugar lactone lactonase YvrE